MKDILVLLEEKDKLRNNVDQINHIYTVVDKVVATLYDTNTPREFLIGVVTTITKELELSSIYGIDYIGNIYCSHGTNIDRSYLNNLFNKSSDMIEILLSEGNVHTLLCNVSRNTSKYAMLILKINTEVNPNLIVRAMKTLFTIITALYINLAIAEKLSKMVIASQDSEKMDSKLSSLRSAKTWSSDKLDLVNTTTFYCMFDLDKFSNVNNTYGHQTGDEVLLGFADILVMTANSLGGKVYRFGGEEFIITCNNNENLINNLEDMRIRLSKTDFYANETKFNITVSIGVYLSNGEDADTALKIADGLLYEAKHSGRNKLIYKNGN